MKALFLCERTDTVFRVYNTAVLEELQTLTSVEPVLFTKADILREPERFAETEYLFSTWGMPVFTEQEIAMCFPSLKAVFYGAGTVQAFARPFLARGVTVISAWAANAVPVAEMTVAQIVLANKGYYLTGRLYHSQGRLAAKDAFAKCRGNYGNTVGIIGAGMIGRLVIQMLKQYRLNVLVYDPFLSDERARALGVETVDLRTLFERSFVVSNHLADNAQTKRILHYDLFKRMTENAVFINTGRGAQVVEDDLVRILNERPDLTALLDVTEPEPPVGSHPFYTLPNCLLTPHIAGSAGDEVARMGEYMLDELKLLLSGERCRYEVTLAMLETMA